MTLTNFIDPELIRYVDEQGAYLNSLSGHFAPPSAQVPPLLPAQELVIPGGKPVVVRIIQPQTDIKAVYLHIHGGGFMHGNAAMSDAANSVLARDLGLACVDVEYRLAPQHPYPAAVDDCVAAASWLIEHAQTQFGVKRLLMGGESVGASLSVMTLLKLREQGNLQRHFVAANLIVGNYDFSMTPSQRASTPQHFLSPQHLAEMRAAMFPGMQFESLRDPYISTLYAGLQDMPAALFTVGTADAVLDDSLFMAARWQAAGNAAELAVYPEAPHLFMTYPTQMAVAARHRVHEFLRRYSTD